MSYFFEEDNSFSLYESPKAGSEAIRTWVYYAGSATENASTDEYYFGQGKTFAQLQEFGYTDAKFLATPAKTKIALYRDPVERFISTFYVTRISNKFFDTTLDYFLENFDDVIDASTHKTYSGENYLRYMFSTQTYSLGSDKSYYTDTVPYRKYDAIRLYLEKVWSVGLPTVQLPNVKPPCTFTGHVCEFDLTTRQKNKVKEIYAEDYNNGWF